MGQNGTRFGTGFEADFSENGVYYRLLILNWVYTWQGHSRRAGIATQLKEMATLSLAITSKREIYLGDVRQILLFLV